MTTKPFIPLTVKYIISGTRGSTPWVNVMYGGVSLVAAPPIPLIGIQALADLMWTQYTTKVNQWFGSTSQVTQVECLSLESATGFQAFHTGSVPGALAGAPAPPQACILIKHTIALHYRGGHPRSYITPPDGATIVAGNQWPAPTVAGMQTQWNSAVTAMNAFTGSGISTHVMGTVQYVDKNVNPIKPFYLTTPVFWPWLSSTVEPVVATQRRRVGR